LIEDWPGAISSEMDTGGRTAAVCCGAAILVAVAARLLVPVAICDDAYITMKTAQNLAAGAGLSFNRGEVLYVSTAPLWALLIATLRAGGLSTVLATRLLGCGAEALLAAGMTRLGRVVLGSPIAGLMAALLVETNPAFLLTSFSGMEAPLALAVVAWSLSYAAERRWAPALAIASAAIWVRFDGFLLLAVVAGFAFLERRRASVLLLGPALAVVAGYFVFGALVFGDWVPISVQRKLGAAPFLSREWLEGAGLVAANFALVTGGFALSWYHFVTPLAAGPLAVASGAWRSVKERNPRLVVPCAFAAVYILVYVGSGRAYAAHFPWYFLPPLVPFALLGARALRLFTRPLTVAIFAVVMLLFCRWAARPSAEMASQREGGYAAATLWLSGVLPPGSTVAANEIGTVGFHARDDIRVLDLFGLLRPKQERTTGAMELMARYRPEAVVTRHKFDYRENIDAALPGAYRWIDTGDLLVGLRADLAQP
jgi:hypothetical protein